MHRQVGVWIVWMAVVTAAVEERHAHAQSIPERELPLPSRDVPPKWLTWAEKTDFRQTPRYEHTVSYCRDLDTESDWIRYESFGTSPEGRDLPLVIAARDGDFTPEDARKNHKLVVLVQNGIHSGECDGKDASLMLLRDIAVTNQFKHLLEHVVLLVIPIYNVDGHERFGPYSRINQNGPEEMGWRTTSQNLNLNRDYMKADAPETRAWLALWNRWNPDFFIDTHTTNGGDWQYDVLYSLETHAVSDPGIKHWIETAFKTQLLEAMAKAGHLCMAYFDLEDGKDPLKGIRSGGFSPRFSNGYVVLRNRPSLLIESHMLKSYRTRVIGQYNMIRHSLELLNRNPDALRTAVAKSGDSVTSWRSALTDADERLPLTVTSTDDAEPIVFKGVSWRRELSPISGRVAIAYDSSRRVDIPLAWYHRTAPAVKIDPPAGYLIPPQWESVLNVLEAHGVKLRRLGKGLKLTVESYRFTDVRFGERPYEGRQTATYQSERISVSRWFPAGSAYVSLDQPGWKVAVHLLEPESPDSFIAWGFFNAVFEQKEYAEDYVLEPLAARMLTENAELRQQFEQRVRSDKDFAADPRRRLYWFYERSPYWDGALNVYPVGRVMSEKVVPRD